MLLRWCVCKETPHPCTFRPFPSGTAAIRSVPFRFVSTPPVPFAGGHRRRGITTRSEFKAVPVCCARSTCVRNAPDCDRIDIAHFATCQDCAKLDPLLFSTASAGAASVALAVNVHFGSQGTWKTSTLERAPSDEALFDIDPVDLGFWAPVYRVCVFACTERFV